MFKTLRQLGSVLILSFILINMWMPVYAQTSTEDCVDILSRNATNIKLFDANEKDITSCLKTSTEIQDKHIKECESSYKSGVVLCDVLYDVRIAEECKAMGITNENSPAYVECEIRVNETKYPECINKLDTELTSCTDKILSEKSTRDKTCYEIFDKVDKDISTKLTEQCKTTTSTTTTPATPTTASICGDGKITGEEECDDKNKLDRDGCSSTCKKEITVAPNIPNTTTLVKPTGKDVSEVSNYLTGDFLPRIARTIIGVAIASAVFGLVLSAVQMLLAFGNEEKLGNAKKGVYFALIGLLIALLSFAIVQLIFFTGFQIGQVK